MEALIGARDQFLEYARQHRAKNTPESTDKAIVNEEMAEMCDNTVKAMLHASCLPGNKCVDCSIDQEPCPTCYRVWWARRHPNVREV